MSILANDPLWKRFLKSKTTYAGPLGLLSGGATLAAAMHGVETSFNRLSVIELTAASGALVFASGQWIRDYLCESEENSLHPIDGILAALRSQLVFGGPDAGKDHGLRLCVHVPRGPEQYYQLTDYFGPKPRTGRGRVFSVGQGVAGEAFRTCKTTCDTLPENRSLIEHLVRYRGYTRSQASERFSDRRSWIALPIGEPGNVIGVIYADAKSSKFFGNGNGFRRKALEAAIPGVAEFVASRYKFQR